MPDEKEDRRWRLTTLVAVVGPLIVVLAGWWLSAQAARDEADRTARREAYTALLSTASECGARPVLGAASVLGHDAVREAAEESGLASGAELDALLDDPRMVATFAMSLERHFRDTRTASRARAQNTSGLRSVRRITDYVRS